jgi:hypothetical protein
MNDVELERCLNCVTDRSFTQVEFIRRKSGKQLSHVLHFKSSNNVDVLSKTSLSISHACDGTNDQIRYVHSLQDFNRVTQDIDLLHDLIISSGIRNVAARLSNRGEVAEHGFEEWFVLSDARNWRLRFVPPVSWPPELRQRRDQRLPLEVVP